MSADQIQAKLRKRLEALLKLPDNLVCCDCRRRGPRWASANLGVFMCIECSGIHRNLGVHISFVRSVNLDSWTEKQVAFMEEWGNGRANALYEADVPSHVQKPTETDSVRTTEKYIRDKYELKKFMGKSIPPKTSYEEEEEDAEPQTRRRASAAKAPTSRPSVSINANAGKASSTVQRQPVKEAPNLLDFTEDVPVAVAQPPVVTQQTEYSAFQSTPQPQQDMFGQFQQPVSATQPAGQNVFGEMQTATAMQPSTAPKASANDILSMFNQPPAMPGPMGWGGMPMGGMPMGGMPMQMGMGMPGMMPQGMPPGQAMMMPQGIPQQMAYGQPQQYYGQVPQMPPQMQQAYGAAPYGTQSMMQQPQQMMGGYPQQQMQYPGNQMPGMPPQPQQQHPGAMMGYPQQAPPPVPTTPAPQQSAFNFGSPNSMHQSFGR